MSWCDGDTGDDESMLEKRKALPSLIRKCRRLRKFKSRACEYVGDDAVLALADSCPYLEQANMARCHKIGDLAWERLSLNCPKINVFLHLIDLRWLVPIMYELVVVLGVIHGFSVLETLLCLSWCPH